MATSVRSLLPLVPWLVLALPACRAAGDHGALASGEQPVVQDEREEAEAGAVAAIRAGDYERAQRILGELIVIDSLERARAHVANGTPREALLPLDRALELEPNNVAALFLRGRAAYDAAPSDSQPQFFYEDAFRYFERAYKRGVEQNGGRPGPRELVTLVEASRAKRLVPSPEDALTLARNAARLRDSIPESERPELRVPLERVWAEAAFDSYLAKKRADEDAREFFAETEDQLAALTARADDTWAFEQLAYLYEWEGQLERSVDVVERALEFAPEAETLHDRLVTLLGRTGGSAAVIERYARFREQHPDAPLGYWYGGHTTFYQALDAFDRQERDAAAFAAAERLFRRCRELEPGYAPSCMNYEAICRNAMGWCAYYDEDLQLAGRGFMSMEDVFEGGLRVELAGRLPNGLAGLDFVTRKYSEARQDAEAQKNAAAIGDYLHAYDPEDANLANNAGFLNRDAAVLFEIRARRLRRQVERATEPAERTRLAEDAQRDMDTALTLMRRSWAAYQQAARLAPDDVRIVNDAGLVMTYYLRTDADEAERLLEQAARQGDQQVAETQLEGRALFDLNEAWGDAYQNLGVLYLTIRNDPAAAKPYFEKALEIGPPSRAWIRESLLPVIDRMIAGETVAPEEYASMVWLHQPQN
jgi:tetratricopeptide (TPR) repeat protein